MWGNGKKSKTWSLGDGKNIVATWSYFCIMWCPLASNIKWYLVGDMRSEDKMISYEEVQKLVPLDTPEIPWFDKYGILVFIALLIISFMASLSNNS